MSKCILEDIPKVKELIKIEKQMKLEQMKVTKTKKEQNFKQIKSKGGIKSSNLLCVLKANIWKIIVFIAIL